MDASTTTHVVMVDVTALVPEFVLAPPDGLRAQIMFAMWLICLVPKTRTVETEFVPTTYVYAAPLMEALQHLAIK